MIVRPRESAGQAAVQALLARHSGFRVARLGELVHPLDYPAFAAETAGGRLLGVLTYVPGQDWRQCEILTLHAGEQWHASPTARDTCSNSDLVRATSYASLHSISRASPSRLHIAPA